MPLKKFSAELLSYLLAEFGFEVLNMLLRGIGNITGIILAILQLDLPKRTHEKPLFSISGTVPPTVGWLIPPGLTV